MDKRLATLLIVLVVLACGCPGLLALLVSGFNLLTYSDIAFALDLYETNNPNIALYVAVVSGGIAILALGGTWLAIRWIRRRRDEGPPAQVVLDRNEPIPPPS